MYSSLLAGRGLRTGMRRAAAVSPAARLAAGAMPKWSPLVATCLARMFATEKLFDKLLVANRGEIACRVMTTCKRLGIKTVAVFSEADRYSKHVDMADEKVYIGPAPSSQSYLVAENIVAAIQQTGAQAVHPGYGFLSENAKFCKRLTDIDVAFVGPPEVSIIAMGDKIQSKKIARDAKVNTVPGFLGALEEGDVIKVAREIGYPVMIKASAGGGGKGMRVAWNDAEAISGFRLSRQEAISSFASDVIFIEKFIEEPRHIEIQVLLDKHGNGVYLNERECSIQRRNQKVIEEAPSTFLTPETRKKMGEQAIALAKACGYFSAGTVEFLVDKHRNFYFLEMNTRLQVEHPVSEFITGVDLVEQMIRVAAGHKLPFEQKDIPVKGWAFESRVYAEDPYRNFLPSIGQLTKYVEPTDEKGEACQFTLEHNVRTDSGIREGDNISIYYDPMISKLVTYGATRDEALERMRNALDTYVIRGVRNNVCFLRSLCDHPRFIKGDISTKFIQEEYPQGYQGHQLTPAEVKSLVAAVVSVQAERIKQELSIEGQLPGFQKWKALVDRSLELTVRLDEIDYEAELRVLEREDVEDGMEVIFVHNNDRVQVNCSFAWGDDVFSVTVDGETRVLQLMDFDVAKARYTLQLMGTQYHLTVRTPREAALQSLMLKKVRRDTSKMILSPMPGSVFSVSVAVGDSVVAGQEVCIVEAMKMQNALRAVADGKVKKVLVKKGQTVSADEVLIEFE